MNVLIINGSARESGFSNHIANALMEEIKASAPDSKNITVNYFNIPKKNVGFCRGCVQCCADEKKYCFINDDIKEAYELMEQADSIVYISPIYESFISGILKNFFDRTNHYTSFFKLAGKNLNLVLSGVQPLNGETKEFSNSHVVTNISEYFENYSIITHTRYTFLGFINHINHHSNTNDEAEEELLMSIKSMVKIILNQKIDKELIESSKIPYAV